MSTLGRAPAWEVAEWLNAPAGFGTTDLHGRVVVAAAFQMLCPGCVEHTIPQLRRAASLFPADRVAVVALHTVFEHHEAMTPVALRAFLHEYGVTFPVAVDRADPDGGAVPLTMAGYGLQGTPTTLILDGSWSLRRRTLGHVPDLRLGWEVAELLREDPVPPADPAPPGDAAPVARCADGVCAV